MKKVKFSKKLQLNKETIANLNEIRGGGGAEPNATWSLWSCNTNHRTCDPCCGSGTATTTIPYSCQPGCPVTN